MNTIVLFAWLTTGVFVDATATLEGGRPPGWADPTIRRALACLGQAVDPIEVVGRERARQLYSRIPGALAPSPGMVAFRLPDDEQTPRIFVNRESEVYRKAASSSVPFALLKLAAVLIHEQVHATDGEHAAYRLQADFVRHRLKGLSWRERTVAHQHLDELEGRATTFRRVESWTAVAPGGMRAHSARPDDKREAREIAAVSAPE